MKRFIDRLPLIFLILTLLSLVLMIIVRISAAGTKLLSTGSGAGKFIAAYYHPSIVVFAVILVIFLIMIFTVRLKQYYWKKRTKAENEAFTPGDVEYPPGPLVFMNQIEANGSDAEAEVQQDPENARNALDAEISSEADEDGPAEAVELSDAGGQADPDEQPDAAEPAAFKEEADITVDAETPENVENRD